MLCISTGVTAIFCGRWKENYSFGVFLGDNWSYQLLPCYNLEIRHKMHEGWKVRVSNELIHWNCCTIWNLHWKQYSVQDLHETFKGSPKVYVGTITYTWNWTPRTLGHSCGQHDRLCPCSGFLYSGTERREQEVSGQLVPLCPNGSYDVLIFLKDTTVALRYITSCSLSLMSDCCTQL